MPRFDLIVVGAGPAGMSATQAAARAGLRVLLLEEQPTAGGQVYRNVSRNQSRRSWLGKDYAAGAQLVAALDHPNVTPVFNATVWRVEQGATVVWSRGGTSEITSAPHVLLASGAQERPVPFPGWTLPGVMTAGSAQILMKSAGMLPRDAVLAGSGPLLYLLAAQMIDAGCPPKALVETQTRAMMARALPLLPRAVLGAPTLAKGIGLLRKIRKAGILRFLAAQNFRAHSKQADLLEFSFTHEGQRKALPCRLLLTHQGVIPATHMSRAAGISQAWNDDQRAFGPVADAWGATDVSGLHVAGDGVAIAGVDAAAASGELAVLDILHRLERISADTRNQRAAAPRATLCRARSIRPFLDVAYAPPEDLFNPPDETVVCRCETISAGEIRSATLQGGVDGARQIKTTLRVGMGPCQGRMCDPTVRGILASCTGLPAPSVAPPRARSPIKPVALGELASLVSDAD